MYPPSPRQPLRPCRADGVPIFGIVVPTAVIFLQAKRARASEMGAQQDRRRVRQYLLLHVSPHDPVTVCEYKVKLTDKKYNYVRWAVV